MCYWKVLGFFGVYGLFALVSTVSSQASDYGFATISLKDGTVQTVQLELDGPKETLTSYRNVMYLPDEVTTLSGTQHLISTFPMPECFNNCDRMELQAKGTSTGRVILRFNVEHREVPRLRPSRVQSDGTIYNPEATGWTIEGSVLIRNRQVLPLVLTSSGDEVGTLTWVNASPERVR